MTQSLLGEVGQSQKIVQSTFSCKRVYIRLNNKHGKRLKTQTLSELNPLLIRNQTKSWL